MLFKGSGVAIVTPFKENGEINYPEMEKLLDFHLSNDTDAIIVAGTTGEASAMTDEEQVELIDFTVKKINHRIPVIAGAGSNDTRHGVGLTKMCCDTGIDGLLQVTPYYNKTTQEGLMAHFEAIADASTVPIILYDVPGRTGMSIEPRTVKRLSEIDGICGLKDATGNISYTIEVKRLVGDDFAIYSGNDDIVVPLLAAGGHGVISVAANCVPKEFHELCAKFFRGDLEGSLEIQLKYKEWIDALFYEVNPIPVRKALELMGYRIGDPRLPLVKASKSCEKELKRTMIEAGIIHG